MTKINTTYDIQKQIDAYNEQLRVQEEQEREQFIWQKVNEIREKEERELLDVIQKAKQVGEKVSMIEQSIRMEKSHIVNSMRLDVPQVQLVEAIEEGLPDSPW